MYVFLISSHPSFNLHLLFMLPLFPPFQFYFPPLPLYPAPAHLLLPFCLPPTAFSSSFSIPDLFYFLAPFFFLFWGEFRLKLTDSQTVTLGGESWE